MRLGLLYPAWLLAILATLGSLYFSEVRMFVPCVLCWYQRILMYPLVLILGVTTYRQDERAFAYSLPLSLLGMFVALYHLLEQKIEGFGAAALCQSGVPCSTQYINWLGFISIPVLSLTAFTGISVLLLLSRRQAARARRAEVP
ncbi:MAG TPA: disulfide oxidoreductase [Trueperaceae bacterium]|nr:disulfide oxidoreductase [Trueperaceae bacterium]